MSKPSPTLAEVKDILAWCKAREQPGCTADRLVAMQSFLLNHTSNREGEEWHWFCRLTAHPSDDSISISPLSSAVDAAAQRNFSTITEVATYLLTLHTYKSNASIQTFKDHLSGLLGRCTGCVEGYLKAKRVLEEDYLSYTSAASLENFFTSIARWELSFIIPPLSPTILDHDSTPTKTRFPHLVDIPPSLVHLILQSPTYFQEPSVREFFEQEAANLAQDEDKYSVELSGVLDHSSFPFIGEGHLELLMYSWTDASEEGEMEEARELREKKSERLRRLGSLLLPPKKSLPIDRFPETLPTIERILSSLFSPAASREPAQITTRKWVAFQMILDRLTDRTIREAIVLKLLQPDDPTGLFFKVDRGDRWAEKYCRGKTGRSNLIVTLVCSRLGVQDQSFYPIFQCFHLLFNPTGRLFWINAKLSMSGVSSNAPAPPNPLDIFRTIKDNPAFLDKLSLSSDEFGDWLDWVTTFVTSFLPVPIEETRENPFDLTFSAKGKGKDVLAKGEIDWFSEGLKEAIYFLMESAQHLRFGPTVRVSAMEKAFKILTMSHQSLELSLALSPQRSALSSVYEMYSSMIAGIALSGKDYHDPIWHDIRSSARDVLFNALVEDEAAIRLGVMALANILQTAFAAKKSSASIKGSTASASPTPLVVPFVTFKKGLWSNMYDALGSKDPQGVAVLIRVISRFSHLDLLPTASDSAWSVLHVSSDRQALQKVIGHINEAISITRRLFARSIERFANLSDNKTLLELWSTIDVTPSALSLLLSPNEEIHDSVQALIQQSFNDVVDRADCFRALLKHSPEEGLEGIDRFLDQFVKCATMFPEACAMAKWMVRCLTDVIDVLCHHGGALLRDDAFIDHFAVRRLVPEIWSKMCDSLAVIFKRTSEWSKFYENEVMVDWMRDALIFARLMAAQTRTFEGATVPPSRESDREGLEINLSQASPSRMSTVGKMMISSLQKVLLNLLNWLRITDVETLYQSFELIKTLLDRFKRSQITPELASLEKLNMFTQRGEKHRCNLKDSQLAEISELLSFWDVSDDDVVFSSFSSRSSLRLAPSSKLNHQGQSSSSSRQSSARPLGSEDEFDDEFPDISESDLRAIDNATKNLVQRQLPFGPLSSSSNRATRPSGPNLSSSSMLSRASGGTGFGKISKSTSKDKKAKSSSSSSSRAMKELRKEFKRSVPTIPAPGMKVGFQIKTSHTKSEIEPSKANRRTDTAGSSSSESSSDSSDTDEEKEKQGLAALSTSGDKRAPVVRKLAPAQPVRSIKMMNDIPMKTPAQIRAAQREAAQRTRLRLKPDMDELHRIILKWEPKDVGQYPPGMEPNQLRKIPAQFKNAEDYLAIFAPLLMLECWAQVQKAIEESQNEDRIVVAVTGKQLIDDWVDVDVAVPTGQINQRYFLTDVDVVQVCSVDPHKPASFFAKVTNFKKGFTDIQVTIRLHSSRNHHSFVSRSKWRLQRVLNLSTMHREFAGLRGLPYFDTPLSRNPGDTLMNAVLKAESFPPLQFSSRDIQEAMKTYAVNEPQAKAVLAAMDQRTTGFVLIQGPPGTGKTKTISGLVGKFLSDRPPPVTSIGSTKRNEETSPPLKILVCAPSNAAIDEVAKRLKEGLRSSSGKIIVPKIVRVGNDDAINIAVKDVALDELVEQKLNGASSTKNDGAADVERIRKELNELIALRNLKVDQLKQFEDDAQKSRALEDDIMKINSRRTVITSQLNKAKDQDRDANRSMNAARRKARQDVINEADIVCTTLSGAGHDLLSSCNFETVIIDEAAQAVELSALIPLKYECKRCIMVGDPNQLPPTVLSQTADRYNYSESLFVRIQRRAPQNVHLLSIQYRMHPDISKLPSKVFYDGRLADGPEMAKKTIQPWHASSAFSPYRFYNVNSSREMAGSLGHSLKNTAEATVALNIYSNLKSQFPSVDFDYRIGIVTMYKEQKRELIRVFSSQYGRGITSTVDFNTVDGFQGQEKDIIILSCVRAGAPGSNAGIGFLKDSRRMNVALTRAKSSLFIIGHAPTLEGGGAQWYGIVNDAKQRGAMLDYHQYFSFSSAPRVDINSAAPLVTSAPIPPPVALPPRSPPSAPAAMLKANSPGPSLIELSTPKEISQAHSHLKRSRPSGSNVNAPVKPELSSKMNLPEITRNPKASLTNGIEEENKPNIIDDHPSSDVEQADILPPFKKRKPFVEHQSSKASSEGGRSSSPGPMAMSDDGHRNRVPPVGPRKKGSVPKAREAPNLFIPPKRKIVKPHPAQPLPSTIPKTTPKTNPTTTSSILPPFVSSDAPANDSASAKAKFAAFVRRPGGPPGRKR
ncbi:helicase sen1 [Phaffia rhodozyma]|uniref:Helicase sen1 n=1 Tax=Phaffia rhodozyma TaxID=264483 RepID=A0A0F7SHP3_PHARH|nr:helicase sen1 [Phaffia rhodozyma]